MRTNCPAELVGSTFKYGGGSHQEITDPAFRAWFDACVDRGITMNVLEGERFEQRRILHEGRPEWTTVDGAELVLMDGRRVVEAEVNYLPPCSPTKILCGGGSGAR